MTAKTETVETRTCACGCDKEIGKKSKFAPGHDARYVGVTARALIAEGADTATILREVERFSKTFSPSLAFKFEKMVKSLQNKDQAKADAKAARLATRKAEAKGLQGAAVNVKVGRWMKAGIVEVVAGGKPAVIAYADSKGKTARVNVTAKTEWSLA